MKDLLKVIKENEAKISSVLVIVVIALVGYQLFTYFKSINSQSREQTTSAATQEQITPTPAITNKMTVAEVVSNGLPAEYTIKTGDNLWSIAQDAYGSGYEWTKIYDANKDKISDPNILLEDTKINLPKLDQTQTKTIAYTVVAGDNLWNIGVRFCANGFVFTQIATDNGITNPGVISPGIQLKVTCPVNYKPPVAELPSGIK